MARYAILCSEQKMKQIEGWIGKADWKEVQNVKPNNQNYEDGYLNFMMFEDEGEEDDWADFDWPPKKVRVTIEEI